MSTSNQISEEDIKILIEQTGIEREIAKKILKDNKGDIVECIIKIETTDIIEKYNSDTKDIDIEDDDKVDDEVILSRENLKIYREIVDEKDIIYTKKADEKEEKKRKQKLIHEKQENGESIDDLVEKKISSEELYFLRNKGNLTSIQIL